jgi:hypothetical protein
MGKRARARKRKLAQERLAELKAMCVHNHFELRCFSPIHVRVFGNSVVDYWPTTGRVWVLGMVGGASAGTPADAVRLASEFSREELVVGYESARSHLKEIKDEPDNGLAPWD